MRLKVVHIRWITRTCEEIVDILANLRIILEVPLYRMLTFVRQTILTLWNTVLFRGNMLFKNTVTSLN